MAADPFRDARLSAADAARAMAELRDEWLKFPGVHRRWSQFDDVYQGLLQIEQTLSEHMEARKPLFGVKPDQGIAIVAEVAVANAKVLLEVGKAELALL